MKQRILIVDPIDPKVLSELRKKFAVSVKTGLAKKDLLKAVRDCDALIGRTSTKLDKEVFAAAKKLRVIGVHATGWDHIDTHEATKRGIALLGFPKSADFNKDRLQGSFIAAAEHVVLAMLASAGDFYNTISSMKDGRWEKYKFSGTELYGKTIGIVGLGRIGSLVAERAKAFGMRVIAHNPELSLKEAKLRGADALVSLEKLCKDSDFITLHIPKTPETVGLIGKKEISHMKKHAVLINTARAAIVDEKALITALKSGRLRGAAIDVFEHPPHGVNPALVKLDNVLPTPHIAGVSRESLARVSSYIGKSVTDFLRHGKIRGIINPEILDRS